MVWQGPRLGFVARDGKICCYVDAFSTIFLLACFCGSLRTFRFSFLLFFLHAGMFIFFVFFVCVSAICYSQQVRILYSTSYVFFRSSYFSGGVFFVVLSYPVR